jgi:hypothetical protein
MLRSLPLIRLLPLAGAALLGSCAMVVPETIYSPCHVSGSSDWSARIEIHRQPLILLPSRRYELIVSGTVTVPTGGYTVWLEEGPLQEVRPRSQQIMVRTTPPEGIATQAEATHRVSGVFAVPKNVGQVAIRCGDGIIGMVPVTAAPAPEAAS